MLFCFVAKVEPLVSKMKIWSRCIDCLVKTLSTNLDFAFRKTYAVTTRKQITAYKLAEHLINVYLMLFKKIHVVINVVHLMVFKHDIFLCLQFICCEFRSNLKSKNMRDSVLSGRQEERRITRLLVINLLFSNPDFKMQTQNANHVNR